MPSLTSSSWLENANILLFMCQLCKHLLYSSYSNHSPHTGSWKGTFCTGPHPFHIMAFFHSQNWPHYHICTISVLVGDKRCNFSFCLHNHTHQKKLCYYILNRKIHHRCHKSSNQGQSVCWYKKCSMQQSNHSTCIYHNQHHRVSLNRLTKVDSVHFETFMVDTNVHWYHFLKSTDIQLSHLSFSTFEACILVCKPLCLLVLSIFILQGLLEWLLGIWHFGKTF